MKSLNNYISEGLFGNLGIDTEIDKEALKDWIVNNYGPSVNNGGRKPEKIIIGDKDGVPIIDVSSVLQINTNPEYSVAPDGVLPEYCKQILFNRSFNHIRVDSDKRNPFRSFKNLPSALKTDKENSIIFVDLNGDYDTLDFGDIKSYVVLNINKGVTVKRISNIAHSSGLSFSGFSNLADINAILGSFDNCKFSSENIHIYKEDNIKIKTTPQSLSDYVTYVQKLGLYYIIKDTTRPVFNQAGLKLNRNPGYLNFDIPSYSNMSFEFLKYIDPTKIQLISLNDFRRKDIIIPEEDLKSLPRGVLLSIPWVSSMTDELAYYENLKDALGAVVFTEKNFSFSYIYFVKK